MKTTYPSDPESRHPTTGEDTGDRAAAAGETQPLPRGGAEHPALVISRCDCPEGRQGRHQPATCAIYQTPQAKLEYLWEYQMSPRQRYWRDCRETQEDYWWELDHQYGGSAR